jgi:hypothetical protein
LLEVSKQAFASIQQNSPLERVGAPYGGAGSIGLGGAGASARAALKEVPAGGVARVWGDGVGAGVAVAASEAGSDSRQQQDRREELVGAGHGCELRRAACCLGKDAEWLRAVLLLRSLSNAS